MAQRAKTRTSVRTSRSMVGKTVRLLDGRRRVIKEAVTGTSYRMDGTRHRLSAYHIRLRDGEFEQVTADFVSSCDEVIDKGGYADYVFNLDGSKCPTVEHLIGADGVLLEDAADKLSDYLNAHLSDHLFDHTALKGTAHIKVSGGPAVGSHSIQLKVEIDLAKTALAADLTADLAFEELHKLGRSISELRRMSDSELMDVYCALLKTHA